MDRILAIVALRFKLLARSVRSASGAVNLLSSALMGVFGALFSLAMAVGFGILLHVSIGARDPKGILIASLVVFYTFFFLGIVLPILRGAVEEGFDAAPFLVFPLSRGRLYAITLASCFGSSENLLVYPALAAVFVSGVLLPGANAVLGFSLLLLFLLFCVAWANTVALLLVSIMRRRTAKEMIALVFFLLLVAASMVPPLLTASAEKHEGDPAGRPDQALRPLLWAAGVLPPSVAAAGLASLHTGPPGTAWGAILQLLLWDAAGIGLGYFVFRRYYLVDSGAGVSRGARAVGGLKKAGSRVFDSNVVSFVPVEIRAVAAKDLRYLLRSVVGKFDVLMLPVFVLIVAFLFAPEIKTPFLGIDPRPLVFYGMLLYTVLFSNNFVNNAFAWEGEGIQAYFMSPVPLRRILAGKNLAVWIFNVLLLALGTITWAAATGIPDAATLLAGALLFGSTLVMFTTVGNFVSVLFPVGRNMSSMTNSPSQAGILISLVSIACAVVLAGLFLAAPVLLGVESFRPLFLVLLLGIQVGAYVFTLGIAVRLMESRKEKLIAALGSSR